MPDLTTQKEELLDEIGKLQEKYELSKTIGDDYYKPGMMEFLDQYLGQYNQLSNTALIRTEVKGLRYENRTPRLDYINVGDSVSIVREESNTFNSNNFMVLNERAESLGNLSAELCNAIAPLYDMGYVILGKAKVSYLQRIKERSRYAKQGILFVELQLKFRGI